MCKSFMCGCGVKKWCTSDVGLLILRLALGAIFVVHGSMKFMAIDQTKSLFMMFHIPVFLVYVVAFIELVAGLSMILGIFTFISGVLLALVMVGAVVMIKSKLPISMSEIDLMAFASALALAFVGPGKYSITKFCKCGGACIMCKCNSVNACAGICSCEKKEEVAKEESHN